jgi:Asparagine synthase
MFISLGSPPLDERFNSLATDRFTIYWKGLVYSGETTAGRDTVRAFADNLAGGLPAAASRLMGMFFVVVHDRVSRNVSAFVDSSGLFHVFHSGLGLSTSFLELVARHKYGIDQIDRESLVEFFHFGYLSFGKKTFFSDIGRLDSQKIWSASESGNISFQLKETCDIGARPPHSFEDAIRLFANSVTGEKLSVDLTGGIDSRLLAVTLRYIGASFELAVSGEGDNPELPIAETVAKILDRPLHIHRHDIQDFDSSIPNLFRVADGLFDIAEAHQPLQAQQQRRSRGITLMATGVGGELFKDFWWLQDFPFYSRKTSNLERLYDYRIVPLEPRHDYLAGEYASISRQFKQKALHVLSHYTAETNTQTYDRIYYYMKMRDVAGRFLSNHVDVLQCYAPYLEPETAAIGYHLPRSKRFFNRFHRETTTHYSPAAARVPTTAGGITVSSEFAAVSTDLLRYAQDKLNRVGRKLTQRVTGRRSKVASPVHAGLSSAVREHILTRNAFEVLKDAGIIKLFLRFDHVPDEYLGRILSLGLLFNRLGIRISDEAI